MSIWFHIQTHKRYKIFLFETVEFEYRWRRNNWRWSFCQSRTLTQIFIVKHICWLNANFWRYVASRALPLLQLFNDNRSNGAPEWSNDVRFIIFICQQIQYLSTQRSNYYLEIGLTMCIHQGEKSKCQIVLIYSSFIWKHTTQCLVDVIEFFLFSPTFIILSIRQNLFLHQGQLTFLIFLISYSTNECKTKCAFCIRTRNVPVRFHNCYALCIIHTRKKNDHRLNNLFRISVKYIFRKIQSKLQIKTNDEHSFSCKCMLLISIFHKIALPTKPITEN